MPPFPDTHAMSNRAACWMASQDRQTAQRRLEASTEGMSVGNTSPGIAVNVREGRLFSRRRRPFSFLSRNRTTWNCYLVNVGVASLEILLRKHESCRNLEAKFGFKAESEKHDPTKTNAATQIELEEG